VLVCTLCSHSDRDSNILPRLQIFQTRHNYIQGDQTNDLQSATPLHTSYAAVSKDSILCLLSVEQGFNLFSHKYIVKIHNFPNQVYGRATIPRTFTSHGESHHKTTTIIIIVAVIIIIVIIISNSFLTLFPSRYQLIFC